MSLLLLLVSFFFSFLSDFSRLLCLPFSLFHIHVNLFLQSKFTSDSRFILFILFPQIFALNFFTLFAFLIPWNELKKTSKSFLMLESNNRLFWKSLFVMFNFLLFHSSLFSPVRHMIKKLDRL